MHLLVYELEIYNPPVKNDLIQKLYHYIFCGLSSKYQLENLDTNNWNTSALKTFQSDTTQDVEAQGQALASNMMLLANELTMLSNRVSAVESLTGRMNQAETDIAWLEKQQEETAGGLEQMQARIDEVSGEIDEILQSVDADEDGNPTIGGEGKSVFLVGKVYINGKLYE